MSKVLRKLGDALPDERPLLSLQIVESVAKCPAGYKPVSRTYDEDADAGLLRQTGLFGKKPSHYICLSKSEGVPGYVMDGVVVVGEREPAPAGFSVAGRAGKRRLCTRVSRPAAPHRAPAVTDVIVCSRMRSAPQGFILAGKDNLFRWGFLDGSNLECKCGFDPQSTKHMMSYHVCPNNCTQEDLMKATDNATLVAEFWADAVEINGKMVCYKVSGGSSDVSPVHNEYENLVTHLTPEANRRLRPAPERPPKLSPLISDLNNLNLKSPTHPHIEEFTTDHDYEALSPSYVKPARAAPRPPVSPAAPPRVKGPAPLPRNNNYQTLGGYSGLEGVPFLLNPKLRGLPDDALTQLPSVKRRTRFELDREYSYNFATERQT